MCVTVLRMRTFASGISSGNEANARRSARTALFPSAARGGQIVRARSNRMGIAGVSYAGNRMGSTIKRPLIPGFIRWVNISAPSAARAHRVARALQVQRASRAGAQIKQRALTATVCSSHASAISLRRSLRPAGADKPGRIRRTQSARTAFPPLVRARKLRKTLPFPPFFTLRAKMAVFPSAESQTHLD